MIILNSFQKLATVVKSSIVNVTGVLDSFLLLIAKYRQVSPESLLEMKKYPVGKPPFNPSF